MNHSDLHRGLGDPDCETCGGLGYVSHEVDPYDKAWGKLHACHCFKQSQLPQDFELFGEGEHSIWPIPGREKAEAKIQEWAEGLEAAALTKSLTLWGKYGTGKTHIAEALGIQAMLYGYNFISVTATAICQAVKDTYDYRDAHATDVYAKYIKPILLFIDEIDAPGMDTEHNAGVIHYIFDARINLGLPTIFCINEPWWKDTPARWARVKDRMTGGYVVDMGIKSLRPAMSPQD